MPRKYESYTELKKRVPVCTIDGCDNLQDLDIKTKQKVTLSQMHSIHNKKFSNKKFKWKWFLDPECTYCYNARQRDKLMAFISSWPQ
tara:strand:+ start:265 stop:525 length:261 start_codon:yes stop_codon:yes gene_type:complete